MKKNAGKLFLRSFIKSFIIVAAFIIVGTVSYWAVMHFLNIPAAETLKASPDEKTEKITEPSVDEISKNLIYCVDDKNGSINKILLEIFHCKNKKLTYITIPVRTSFTMSDTLYRRLVPVNPTIPQLLKLSGITKYFSADTVYEYGVLLLEDLLKIKISYYTVIPESVYDTVFQTEDKAAVDTNNEAVVTSTDSAVTGADSGTAADTDGTGGAGRTAYPKEIFTDEYIKFLKTLKTQDDIKQYINNFYSSVQSNLSLSGKLNYVESYSKTPLDNVSFELIGGTNENSAYRIDEELAAEQIAACTSDASD